VKADLSPYLKDRADCVFVGDFGQTAISDRVLKAYGIERWPIDESSPSQIKALERLNRIVPALQEHAWIMENVLGKLE
jgi:hypothetical protein